MANYLQQPGQLFMRHLELTWQLHNHLLNFVYRDFAKTHAHPDKDGNIQYHWAGMGNIADYKTVSLDKFLISNWSLLHGQLRYQRN